jgi:hypothetical protein
MARKRKVSVKSLAKMDMDTLAALPGMLDLRLYDISDGKLWDPQEKRLVTGNPVTALAWAEKLQSQGFLSADEVQEEQTRMRLVIRAARGEKEYDPASVVNKKSGYGQKPGRKPTRDYKGSRTVAAEGYAPVRVSLGKGWVTES